jgi:hypothetical protein
MSETMSREFVTAFLSTCFESGIEKEAAAELLQKESIDRVRARRPAFSEGYEKVASQLPGRMQPVIFRSPDLEKYAGRSSGLLSAIRHLRGAVGGVGQAAGNAAATGFRGAKWGVQNPLMAGGMLGAAGTAGLAGYGGYQLTNPRARSLTPYGDRPFEAPGGYQPGSYQSRVQSGIDSQAPSIYQGNAAMKQESDRIAVLRKGVESGEGGASPRNELRAREKALKSMTAESDAYGSRLIGDANRNRGLIGDINDRTAELESQRTSLWGLPKRTWLRMTGRKPSEHFNKEIGRLDDNRSWASMDRDIAVGRGKKWGSGATGTIEPPQVEPRSIQRDFFPTFD